MVKTKMLLIAAAALAAVSVSAQAANVFFGEKGDTTFATPDANFEFGSTTTHMNIGGGEDDLLFTGSFFTNSADGTGGNVLGLAEPGVVNSVSDFLISSWTVAGGVATVSISFLSDPAFCEGQSFCGSGTDVLIPEDGTIQDITQFLSLPANITVEVQSEVTETPEPAAVALFGFGLVGLTLARRRV